MRCLDILAQLMDANCITVCVESDLVATRGARLLLSATRLDIRFRPVGACSSRTGRTADLRRSSLSAVRLSRQHMSRVPDLFSMPAPDTCVSAQG